jgi:acyl transferase domain-containing protein
MAARHLDGSEIAVVGLAGRFPGAAGPAELWDNLSRGVESVRRLTDAELDEARVPPAARRDRDFVPYGAPLDGAELFDAGFFGYSHREAEILDPQQRLFLECCWQALEDAGRDPAGVGVPVGVFGGATTSTYLIFHLASNPQVTAAVDPLQLLVANAADSLTTRVAYKLDLQGPSFTVQCACSTSLVAVHLACQSLLAEECDLALAGGVSVPVSQRAGYRYRPGSILSPDGCCRPFDARAAGTVFGSGAGVVALRRAADALADGDPIRALILGSAVNNDGSFKVGYTAPSVDGQAGVIAEALSAAGVEPESLGYVEAHGTGTSLGDPIEIQAVTKAFRAFTERTGFCATGSVKGNVGHLDVAAGVAGLIKTVLALEHAQVPPSLHFETPNPKIDFAASPVYVNTALAPWPRREGPRRAGVSSFGFGGTNAHVVLEEAPAPLATAAEEGPQLLVLSARSDEALRAAAGRLAEHLAARGTEASPSLADVAWTLQTGRRTFERRLAVVASSREQALRCLGAAARGEAVPEPIPAGDAAAPLAAAGRDWTAGRAVDWNALHAGRRRRVPLPTYPFERQRYWIDPAPAASAPPAAGAGAAEAAAPPPPAQELHPRPALSTPYVEPRNELERLIASVWGRVLGVDRVGVHDNFFDLGGDSLIAVHAADALRAELARELPVVSLYEGLTVASLAKLLAATAEAPPEAAAGRLEALRRERARRDEFLARRGARSPELAVGTPPAEKGV